MSKQFMNKINKDCFEFDLFFPKIRKFSTPKTQIKYLIILEAINNQDKSKTFDRSYHISRQRSFPYTYGGNKKNIENICPELKNTFKSNCDELSILNYKIVENSILKIVEDEIENAVDSYIRKTFEFKKTFVNEKNKISDNIIDENIIYQINKITESEINGLKKEKEENRSDNSFNKNKSKNTILKITQSIPASVATSKESFFTAHSHLTQFQTIDESDNLSNIKENQINCGIAENILDKEVQSNVERISERQFNCAKAGKEINDNILDDSVRNQIKMISESQFNSAKSEHNVAKDESESFLQGISDDIIENAAHKEVVVTLIVDDKTLSFMNKVTDDMLANTANKGIFFKQIVEDESQFYLNMITDDMIVNTVNKEVAISQETDKVTRFHLNVVMEDLMKDIVNNEVNVSKVLKNETMDLITRPSVIFKISSDTIQGMKALHKENDPVVSNIFDETILSCVREAVEELKNLNEDLNGPPLLFDHKKSSEQTSYTAAKRGLSIKMSNTTGKKNQLQINDEEGQELNDETNLRKLGSDYGIEVLPRNSELSFFTAKSHVTRTSSVKRNSDTEPLTDSDDSSNKKKSKNTILKITQSIPGSVATSKDSYFTAHSHLTQFKTIDESENLSNINDNIDDENKNNKDKLKNPIFWNSNITCEVSFIMRKCQSFHYIKNKGSLWKSIGCYKRPSTKHFEIIPEMLISQKNETLNNNFFKEYIGKKRNTIMCTFKK